MFSHLHTCFSFEYGIINCTVHDFQGMIPIPISFMHVFRKVTNGKIKRIPFKSSSIKVFPNYNLHDHNSLCVVLGTCSESGLAFGFVENKKKIDELKHD